LEWVSRVEVWNGTVLASARNDAEGPAWRVTLLGDNLVVDRWAQQASEWEYQAHFEELTLLQTQGSELCHAIIDPPQVKHHLSEGMQLATLCHTEMAEELTVFQAAVSSTVESVLGWMSWSPNSKRWMGEAHDLRALPLRSMTYCLGHHPVGSSWSTVWMKQPDSLERN
jgi:hypothetical protein